MNKMITTVVLGLALSMTAFAKEAKKADEPKPTEKEGRAPASEATCYTNRAAVDPGDLCGTSKWMATGRGSGGTICCYTETMPGPTAR